MTSPPGLLYVESEPQPLVSLDEYTDWYDNEHVPLRMKIPEFLTGRRYVSIDEQKPSYVAVYEISVLSLFTQDRYTKLRTNRSPRETDIVKRLEVLDRRTCEVIKTSSDPGKAEEFLVSVVITPKEAVESENGFEKAWLEIEELRNIPGYKRALKSKLVDGLMTGSGKEPVNVKLPQYIGVYEFSSNEHLSEERIKKLFLDIKDTKEVKIRVWKLYGEWKNTSKET